MDTQFTIKEFIEVFQKGIESGELTEDSSVICFFGNLDHSIELESAGQVTVVEQDDETKKEKVMTLIFVPEGHAKKAIKLRMLEELKDFLLDSVEVGGHA